LVEALHLYYDTQLGVSDKPRYVSTAVSSVTSFAKTGASKNTNQYTSVPKVGFSKNYADREVSNSNASGTTTKRAFLCVVRSAILVTITKTKMIACYNTRIKTKTKHY